MADKPSPMPVSATFDCAQSSRAQSASSRTLEGTMPPPKRRPPPSSSSFACTPSSSRPPASTNPYPFAAHSTSSTSYGTMASSQLSSQTPPLVGAIATSPRKPAPTQGKMDLNTLMSPPDQVMDIFPQDGQRTFGPLFSPTNLRSSSHRLPMSPPHSPTHRTLDAPTTPARAAKAFSGIQAISPSADPLPRPPSQAWSNELERTHRQAIEQHRREHPFTADINRPSDHDYLLTLTFRSKIMDRYREDPRAWLRRNLAQVKHDNRAIANRYTSIMPAKPKPNSIMTPPKAARGPRADRITKPPATGAAPRVIRIAGAPTRTSPGPSNKGSTSRTSGTPEPSRRTVAPNREDKDFESIPNYAPDPWKTLSGSNALKVEWKGQPIDLSNDPHVHLLHPAEVALASNLRLDCATYLTSKRRIFERRLACIRQPKEFRKTDAQQACKIDVNKASKLWAAFDKAGWLQERWMSEFL